MPTNLHHSALEVRLGADRAGHRDGAHGGSPNRIEGVVAEGLVGLRWLGIFAVQAHQVAPLRDGRIPTGTRPMDSPCPAPARILSTPCGAGWRRSSAWPPGGRRALRRQHAELQLGDLARLSSAKRRRPDPQPVRLRAGLGGLEPPWCPGSMRDAGKPAMRRPGTSGRRSGALRGDVVAASTAAAHRAACSTRRGGGCRRPGEADRRQGARPGSRATRMRLLIGRQRPRACSSWACSRAWSSTSLLVVESGLLVYRYDAHVLPPTPNTFCLGVSSSSRP